MQGEVNFPHRANELEKEPQAFPEKHEINSMEGFQPKHWDELSKKERAKALCYLMYLKEKKDRSVKGQG